MDPRRPETYLTEYAKRFPDCWRQFDGFFELRDQNQQTWPDWCFCPMAGAHAIVFHSGTQGVGPDNVHHVGILAALAAWRPTKGVYQFDNDLFKALVETPVSADLPIELFFRLPEWCLYVAVPDEISLVYRGEPLTGFFVHLEYDINHERPELRFVLDSRTPGKGLLPVGIHLDEPTVERALQAFILDGLKDQAGQAVLAKIQRQAKLEKLPVPELKEMKNLLSDSDLFRQIAENELGDLSVLLSLVLYICSTNADLAVAGSSREPTRVLRKKTKQGLRYFPADKPTVWETGWRIGAALRSARARIANSTASEETGIKKAPHTRKAHWHTYLTGAGSKKDPSKAVRVLRWISPLLVGVSDPQAPVVVHRVNRPKT